MSSALKISPELRAALQAYLDWVNVGAPPDEPFNRVDGLCFNICDLYSRCELVELMGLFKAQGLDEAYPFGAVGYQVAQFTKTQHLCAPRINWIKEILETSNE